MGTYTELVFAVNIKKDTPKWVMYTLAELVGDKKLIEEYTDYKEEAIIERKNFSFFQASRWGALGRCGSAYFPGQTHSSLEIDSDYYHSLTIRCNLKDYDYEIDKFLSWIVNYIDISCFDEFLGYYRMEDSLSPILLFALDEFDNYEVGIVERYCDSDENVKTHLPIKKLR